MQSFTPSPSEREMGKSPLYRAALTLLAFLMAFPLVAEAEPGRPNIILIVADDLGYGDLGCYGSVNIKTPHLDRLAAQGTRFTQFYAGAAVCAPSRDVLMTGRHTGHSLIRNNSSRRGGVLEVFAGGREGGHRVSFTAADRTVAETLHDAGYATGAAGKWGLGEPGTEGMPTKRGFDEWLGYLNQNHAAYYYTEYLDEDDGTRLIPENAAGKTAVYSNDLFSDFAIEFVRRHQHRPFFLYLPYTIPHERMEVPDVGAYGEQDWPEDAKIYAAMVSRLDGYIGRLSELLDRLGLTSNTLVMFCSDNGPVQKPRTELLESAGTLRGRKGSLYEGGLRVPMIVRWPGVVPAGRASEVVWWFADIHPTLAALTEATPPPGLDGRDVSSLLHGNPESELANRALYWEYPQDRLWQAARIGQWKGIRYGTDQPLELYDLSVDPAEKHDVSSRRPEQVMAIEEFLQSSHIPSPLWPVK